jgi:rhodanese-related sulfurtransferase
MQKLNLNRKFAIGLFAIAVSLSLAGCFEGYAGPEGDILLQYLDPAALKALTENPEPDIFLIDVRPASAYAAGHIPTALSFPSSEIAGRLNESPLDDLDNYLIVHCETGGRAQGVITGVLEPNGYTRFMNWGGVYRWPYGGVTD